MLPQRLAHQGGTILFGSARCLIGGAKQLGIEHDLDGFHMWTPLHSILHILEILKSKSRRFPALRRYYFSLNRNARKLLWAVSVLGIAASVALCGLSFDLNLVDKLFLWLLPMFGILFVLGILMVFHHQASTGTWRWRWNEQTRGKPAWAAFWFYLLLANFAGHFIWTMYDSGGGVPAIVDGDYVLDSRGHILKELTAEEYFSLRSLDLRLFAMLYLYLYFAHAVYWYDPNDSQEATNS